MQANSLNPMTARLARGTNAVGLGIIAVFAPSVLETSPPNECSGSGNYSVDRFVSIPGRPEWSTNTHVQYRPKTCGGITDEQKTFARGSL
jgi:hypothetical protein